jgi:NAD(P)-dependent dehydrogenase (short-subunit alcohol dehydrogenase family)
VTDNNPFALDGQVALVSGASSGFGAHFARLLARHGARVVVAARRRQKLDRLVDELHAAGAEALAVEVDVTDMASVLAGFDTAETEFGCVTVVSNNAGIVDSKMALAVDEANWDRILDTNLKGAWAIATEAGRRMIEQGRSGSIVNTASILGLRPALAQTTYATSKAGLIHLTKCLALEWARKGIRVNALCPGFFVTDMNRDFLDSPRGRDYLATTPARRPGNIEELSVPFLLLASGAGSFITGETLAVDGGHQLSAL